MRIKVTFIRIHDDIQILIFIFSCWKSAENSHCKLSLKHWNYLYLSIFIFWVLKNLFNGHYLSISFYLSSENLSKSPLPDQTQILKVRLADFHGSAIKGLTFPLLGFQKPVNTLTFCQSFGQWSFWFCFSHLLMLKFILHDADDLFIWLLLNRLFLFNEGTRLSLTLGDGFSLSCISFFQRFRCWHSHFLSMCANIWLIFFFWDWDYYF